MGKDMSVSNKNHEEAMLTNKVVCISYATLGRLLAFAYDRGDVPLELAAEVESNLARARGNK